MFLSTVEVPKHVRSLTATAGTNLGDLANEPLVVISSVRFTTPGLLNRYEALRFRACLAATGAYAKARIPQIVMVDDQSDYRVAATFAEKGAIAVQAPRPGLATPYLDAAQLVRLHAGPGASVLKAEADKLLDGASLNRIVQMLDDGADVLVGNRTAESMATMTPIQQLTEALIDTYVQAALGVPHGTSCGVQAYSPYGLEEFLAYEQLLGTLGNNWKYLISTPALAAQHGLNVRSVPVMVTYDPKMVEAEDNLPITFKRMEQLILMLEGGIEVVSLLGLLNPEHMPPDPERRRAVDQTIVQLRRLVAAATA